jgi:hypothetical protein
MDDLAIKGMILGMEKLGAKLVKSDQEFVFFDVIIGSEIDDEKKLKNAKSAFQSILGLGIKIRRVKEV